MLQVEVGEVGSERHTQRERMLRSAIELQTQLEQSQQKLEALTQQLADTSPSEEQEARVSAEPNPDSPSGTALVKPGDAAARYPTSALMDSLFGSDDDVGDNASQGAKTPAGKQYAGSAAGVAQQRRQTTATAQAGPTLDLAHASHGGPASGAFGQGNSSDGAQRSTAPGPSQQLVDLAAPKRSISFSNSLRRRQTSSIQLEERCLQRSC